jgi:hypothetical protein
MLESAPAGSAMSPPPHRLITSPLIVVSLAEMRRQGNSVPAAVPSISIISTVLSP